MNGLAIFFHNATDHAITHLMTTFTKINVHQKLNSFESLIFVSAFSFAFFLIRKVRIQKCEKRRQLAVVFCHWNVRLLQSVSFLKAIFLVV